jgi:hypothetical protein
VFRLSTKSRVLEGGGDLKGLSLEWVEQSRKSDDQQILHRQAQAGENTHHTVRLMDTDDKVTATSLLYGDATMLAAAGLSESGLNSTRVKHIPHQSRRRPEN